MILPKHAHRAQCWVIILCLTLWSPLALGDVFTSVKTMQTFYQLEAGLLKTLEHAIEYHKMKLELLTKQYKQLLAQRPKDDSGAAEYLSHPVDGFTLVRRLSRDWPLTLQIVSEHYELPKVVEEFIQTVQEKEMQSAVRGLTRLQRVYDLNTDLLADGSVNNIRSITTLTAADCMEIAQFLFQRHEFTQASNWLLTALSRVLQEADRSVPQEQVASQLYLATTLANCENNGQMPRAKPTEVSLLQIQPSLSLDASSAQLYRLALSGNCSWFDESLKEDLIDMGSEDNKMYNKMCRGEPKGTKGLNCYYVHYQNPVLLLAPFKLEEVHLSPPIVMVHQAISDREIQQLQEVSMKTMESCEVLQGNNSVPSLYRTCSRSWLEDYSPVSSRLSLRSEILANLPNAYLELNQVANYGLGGEYKLHNDGIEGLDLSAKDKIGQREATVMFYLNDVVRGGYTVFPKLDVAVAPVKGAAVIWFNIYYNGVIDGRLLHGGCPVLIGQKWVLNKWIRQGVHRYHFQNRCPIKTKNHKDYFYL